MAEANGTGLLPVLVAIVTDAAGVLVGVQRTYLTEAGAKAATSDPKGKVKFSLGQLAGAAIQLAPAGETLIVAEGLEDALSLAQVEPQFIHLLDSAAGWRSLAALAGMGDISFDVSVH